MRDLPVLKLKLSEPEKFGNVAEMLTQSERRTLAVDLIDLIRIDDNSMSEWAGKAQGYLDALKDEGNAKPQDREQDGSNDEPPPSTEMTLSAAIQFSARATDAILGEPDLVRASEVGGEALAAWVSTQFRTTDSNWTLDTDPLVIHMSITGLAWRKRNYDDEDKQFQSRYIPSVGPNRVIINADVRSVDRAPRITEEFSRYPYEIEKSIQRGKWIDYEPRFDENDPQAPKNFYETDAWLDLDGDGITEPWTVVVARDDMPEVIRIRPRWSRKTVVDTPDAIYFNQINRFYPYRMMPDPEGSFLPMGFGRILHRTEASADRILASIIDTAKSESENGGVAGGSQFGLPDKVELKGNRITTLPTDGQPLDKLLTIFPTKSVSPGSVTVLEKIMTLGDRLAGTLNLMENAPASMTATLAKGIMDSGQQVQSAVHRRLVASMTQEARSFVRMADAYDALPDGISPSDGGGVAITADPQLATEMQRAALAGVYMELLKQAAEGVPWAMQELQLRLTQVLRLPNGQKLIGQPKQPELTPDEKAKTMLGVMKHQNDRAKAIGQLALQLTQSYKNLADVGATVQGMQMVNLQMAQLEQAVKSMLDEANNANNSINGMAQQPGNPGADQVPPTAASGDSPQILGGGAGGSDNAGAGSGLQ